MTAVQDVCRTPGVNTPASGVRVVACLDASSRWLADTTGEVVASITTVSGVDGTWSLDLTPTGDYEDGGAFYRLSVGTVTYKITVPDSGGPYNLRSVLAIDDQPGTGGASPSLISRESGNALLLLSDGLYVNGSGGGTGTPGQPRFYGHGTPPLLPTAVTGDLYLDIDTGDFYQFN